jgi:hypothetical protein
LFQSVLAASLTSCRNPSDKSVIFAIVRPLTDVCSCDFSDILSELFRRKCIIAVCSRGFSDILSESFRQKCHLRPLTVICSCDFSDILSEPFRRKCRNRHQTASQTVICSCDFSDILSELFRRKCRNRHQTASQTSCRNSSDKSDIFATRLSSQFFDSSSCACVLAGEHCFSLFSRLL